MNPYLAKILNEEGKSQVQALLNCNIITPTELKEQVISSNNSSYIYYGALAIYNATCDNAISLSNTSFIFEELKQALFNLNDYPYILLFMRIMQNTGLTNVESYLNKLAEANDSEILIRTLNNMDYINSKYLNNEKRKYFITVFIKKLISIKAYATLFKYLNDRRDEDICYIAIESGDRDFLKAYQERIHNDHNIWDYSYYKNTEYMRLITARLNKLSLIDNSSNHDLTLDFFQDLVRDKQYNTIKKYAADFHDLFIGDQAKLTK